MKTRFVTLQDFSGHDHPASKLFRTIELQAVHSACGKKKFKTPSLDLGCGDGYITIKLFDEKFTYGMDNDEAGELKDAKKNNRYKKILKESAESMSLTSNSINFVFSNSVIEHIPNNEAVLSEVSRILKKGGDFVFTSPSHKFKDYLYISNKLDDIGLSFIGTLYKDKRHRMLNHYHTYSHLSWKKRLAKHGLKIINYKYYISRETCMYWDKLALEVRLLKKINKNAENILYRRNQVKLEQYIKNDKVTNSNGGSLVVHAIKK